MLGWAKLLLVAVSASGTAAAGETIIDSFNSVSAWTESTGSTCTKGVSGTLTLGQQGYVGTDALLAYDMTKGNNPNWYTGCSVLITRSVSSLAISPAAIAFWVLAPPDAMVNLDVEDASGQTLTYHLPRPLDALDPTQWYQQVVELDAPTAWSAGGSGIFQGPIQTLALEVQNRASYLTSGAIAFDELGYFDAIGGELDPFGGLTAAPAGSADLASTFAVNVYQSASVEAAMADAGFSFVRADIRWYQNELDAGYYDFSIQDAIQSQLDLYGMKALWVMGGGNPLYGDCAANPDGGFPVDGCAPTSQKSINHFQSWATVVATHFQGTGDRYEIWNEPASTSFKWPDYSGIAYTPVLNAGIAGIHAGDPDAGVTCGGLASPGEGTPVWPGTFAWSFLDTYLDAGGGVGANAVAFHPYRLEGAETVTDDLVLARSIVGAYLSPLPEIWETEWGYDVADDADAGTQGALAWQALYDLRLLLATRAMGFGLSNCFSADYPGFTILSQPGNVFEPASIAVATLTQQLAGRTFAGFIPTTPTSLQALRFDAVANTLVVLWSDVPGGDVDVTLPGPVTAAVDELGSPLQVTGDGGVVAFSIAEANGPVYVTLPWPPVADGGASDAGADAGARDAGFEDAGTSDAGAVDAGGRDAGHEDAGTPDGGAEDAGVVDGGIQDAGKKDAGLEDAGTIDAGIAPGTDGGVGDAGAADGGAEDAGSPGTITDGGGSNVASPPGCGCSEGGHSFTTPLFWLLVAMTVTRRRRSPT